jgi:PAS domain S-box-containing protein
MAGLQVDTSMADVANINGNAMTQDMTNALDLSSYPNDMRMDIGGEDPVFTSVEPSSDFKPMRDIRNGSNETQNAVMSGAGAGPLPTDFGAPSSRDSGGNSTLTEFTKRRNWSQRVLEELRDFLHILTPDGRILYVSPSVKALTGYESSELVGKFISDFVHPDDSAIFIREFNEAIATGHPLRFYYRLRKLDQSYTIFESHGHPHLTSEAAAFGPNNVAGSCRGFFMMSRPYPTKNAELLDSFLEHKIENERLQARIATLRREEQEEAEASAQRKALNGHDSVTATGAESINAPFGAQDPRAPNRNNDDSSTSPSGGNSADGNSMPPPAKPSISNTALTREALDEANAFSRPDSITDKMARYEGSSHVDGIEMLTGLRYGAGERSHGISTGDASPNLIRGDAGIPMSADYSRHSLGGSGGMGYGGSSGLGGDKKFSKKLKAADEYVCTDCGTLDSPEWRKGPSGPKTLCNACGLRWAKKEKKRIGKEGASSAGREGTQDGVGIAGMNQNHSNSGSA